MTEDDLTPGQTAAITAAVDIEAPPPDGEPAALVLFGTNQLEAPVRIAAGRYHRGLAPVIIATGGINRHNGINEGREFARLLADTGVPDSAVRVEDQSKDTWQNVELSMPYLREALGMGLPLVAVSKWYHLRTVYCLRTQLPAAVPLYAIGWEPVYEGTLVTRESWPGIPGARRRVIRESEEVPRRVAEGSYLPTAKKDGAWRLSRELRLSTIYHVTTPADWEAGQAAGEYTTSTRGRTLADVGFLHASTAAQIVPVAGFIRQDAPEEPLVLLVIDTDRLTSPIRHDEVPGWSEPFPHIYGPLNPDAVIEVIPLEPGPGGGLSFTPPTGQ